MQREILSEYELLILKKNCLFVGGQRFFSICRKLRKHLNGVESLFTLEWRLGVLATQVIALVLAFSCLIAVLKAAAIEAFILRVRSLALRRRWTG